MDVADRISSEALVNLARNIVFEFDRVSREKARPLLEVLALLRTDAVEALADLVEVNPTDTEAVRKLQNDVNLYLALLRATRQILANASEAVGELEADDAEAVREDIESKSFNYEDD